MNSAAKPTEPMGTAGRPVSDPRSFVVGILLAAGRARRFGADKLLCPLPDGTPIGLASAQSMRAAVDRMVIVVNVEHSALAQLLAREGTTIVVCKDADEGMGASLACGVRAAGEVDGWVVGLADMPFIRPETIQRVVAALRDGAPIVLPSYGGQRGHPVGFAQEFYLALQALGGDVGARPLLMQHEKRLMTIPVDDPGVLRDVDTPGDLRTDG
jgi:molybdenum cofactor cytidylyltransferase